MKSEPEHIVVLVTAPKIGVARKLARMVIESRAAACANLIPNIESHYWWQDRIESDKEFLILFKTTNRLIKRLEKIVVENHPYDTPEVIALPIKGGNKRYLAWLTSSVTP